MFEVAVVPGAVEEGPGDALLWSRDEHELAHELSVDVGTVIDRLAALTKEEAAEINRRLDEAEVRIS